MTDEPLFRVRMTAGGAGAPHVDREMSAVPRVGDYINSRDSGELRVVSVHWNFDPRIPADVVLFLGPADLPLSPLTGGWDDLSAYFGGN